MTYQVLARKWRPQRFADVVGQDHISRTLQNAILRGRVGHAYLFVGPRGIGKTSLARIFAKALNCEKGMVGEPCCECPSCQEIFRGSALDVIEMDAASHTGVDYIRDIRDTVQYAPTRGRYKIFIIDEVHMLSPAAWNALLKTLEEPPPHVKFLFATTEPHRVLPTILSRCQRLDLKRIPPALIMGRLRQIATAETIWIDDPALAAIARAADGGMRDAQSIFDQMIAFCGGRTEAETIREQDVMDVFGLASGSELKEICQAMLHNEPEGMMTVIQELADRGRDLEHLLADLIYFFRNAMVFQLSTVAPERVLEAGATELDELREVTHGIEPEVVQRLLEGLLGQEYFVRSMLNKRVALEVALVRTVREAHSIQLAEVIARLNALRGDAATPTSPATPGGPAAASRPHPADPVSPTVKPGAPEVPPPRPAAVATPSSGVESRAATSAPEPPPPVVAPQVVRQASPADYPTAVRELKTTCETTPAVVEPVATAETKSRLTSSLEVRRRVEQYPFVQQICTLFNAKVIDARG